MPSSRKRSKRKSRVLSCSSVQTPPRRSVDGDLSSNLSQEDKENHPPSSPAAAEVDIVPEKPSEPEVLCVNPLVNATMDDVKLTEEATNMVAANRKSSMTRLHSIKNVLITQIETKSLRLFCGKIGISGVRSVGKLVIANKIVECKESGSWKELEASAAAKKKKKADENKKVTVNRKRFINVLFSDTVRPKLASLGETLDRADLDRGLKSDQDFYELVASEYNKGHVALYGRDAFPHLPIGRSVPPSHFQPIDWVKAKEVLKSLLNDYDRCFRNWKQSGFHDNEIPTSVVDMTEQAAVPFADFAKNSSIMLYMHEFVFQHPNILEKVSGKPFYCLNFYILP